MRCDLRVHTIHSGMCTVPVFRRICRESYNDPMEVYEALKRGGMDLITVTDHDSIGASEALRKYPDFFLSEEVSCRTPDGMRLHVGVYDIEERHHVELQRRREDLPSLIFYLNAERLLFSVNHVFSRLTGRRTRADFTFFQRNFPLLETRNGQMPRAGNESSARLAARWGKGPVAGSDAHSLCGLGRTYTEAAGARSKAEFLNALRAGGVMARGEAGGYLKLTRSVMEVASGLLLERPWAVILAALLLLVPAVTLAHCLAEAGFERRWAKRVLGRSAPNGGSGIELEMGQVNP